MNLPELKKIAEAATPGPWGHDQDGDVWTLVQTEYSEFLGGEVFRMIGTTPTAPNNPNAEHIAAFNPQTVLRLIETLEVYENALKAECVCGHMECLTCEALAEGAKILRGEGK